MSKFKPIRWTLQQAASEFGIDNRTLAQRSKRTGLVPGKDYKFSTKQICAAVFGDIQAETLRKITEEADKVALANEKTRGTLVEIEAVYRHFEGLFVALRARILASGLVTEEKDELLNDLRKLKARDFADTASGADDFDQVAGHSDAAAAA